MTNTLPASEKATHLTAIESALADYEAVTQAIADGRTPIISVGQFRRLDAAKTSLAKLK